MQDFGGIAGGFAGSLPGSAAGGLSGGGFQAGGSGFGMDRLLMAETLGLVMARRAAQILDRHRESLVPDARPSSLDDPYADSPRPDSVAQAKTSSVKTSPANASPANVDPVNVDPASACPDSADPDGGDADRFALDDAIFTAVLDATNECLGRFDSRPPADRWCDALLHLLDLASYADED
jgi:predicted lipid-binding transport protein (Tim44 family)